MAVVFNLIRFHGDLSEFAVWDSVLTTTEITSGPNTANAVISYEFGEGVGTVVSDLCLVTVHKL